MASDLMPGRAPVTEPSDDPHFPADRVLLVASSEFQRRQQVVGADLRVARGRINDTVYEVALRWRQQEFAALNGGLLLVGAEAVKQAVICSGDHLVRKHAD
jgi:hypothetical protein